MSFLFTISFTLFITSFKKKKEEEEHTVILQLFQAKEFSYSEKQIFKNDILNPFLS